MKKSLEVYDQLRELLVENGVSGDDSDRFDTVASRRRFLAGLGGGGAALSLLGFGASAEMALQGLFGRGMIPAAWAAEAEKAAQIEGKPGMIVHNTRPVNGEFPPHLLNDDVTPNIASCATTAWSPTAPRRKTRRGGRSPSMARFVKHSN